MEETEGQISLELPIEKEFARLLRLLVSGIASRMNFDLDAVDDLKIAIEEAYLMAMREDLANPIKIAFDMRVDRLQIDVEGVRGSQTQSNNDKTDDLGNFILDAVVDEIEINKENSEFSLRLAKYL